MLVKVVLEEHDSILKGDHGSNLKLTRKSNLKSGKGFQQRVGSMLEVGDEHVVGRGFLGFSERDF